MKDKDKEALRDRFSGYQLPTIDLAAGFPAYCVPVHPYYYNQPLEWTKPAYTKYSTTGPQLIGGDFPSSDSGGNSVTSITPSSTDIEISGSSGSSHSIIRKKVLNVSGSNEKPMGGPRTDLLPF